jgi:hypothetical protein
VRASQYTTVRDVEREIARCLEDLRRLHMHESSNIMAHASVEYRIGSLRRRKAALEGT